MVFSYNDVPEKEGLSAVSRLAWFSFFLLVISSVLFLLAGGYFSLALSRAYLDQSENVGPLDTILIKFPYPVPEKLAQSKISLESSHGVVFKWEDSNRKLNLASQGEWEIGKNYQIKMSGLKLPMIPQVDRILSFKTVDYPEVAGFYPENGEKDVQLDIEDPIIISFGKSFDDFKIKIVFSPLKDASYSFSADKREIKLMPKGELEKGKRYDIRVLARHLDQDEEQFKEIYATFFETKPLPPENWDKNSDTRLEQARIFTEPLVANGKYIDINLKIQVMTIFENGKLLDAFMISSGKRGMETPQGNFQVRNKFPRAWSKKYGLFMPFWMAIVPSGDFGIHELPEWPSGYKEGRNHLGIPVSHGCVRLGVGPAERVYNWAEIGTPIIVHS